MHLFSATATNFSSCRPAWTNRYTTKYNEVCRWKIVGRRMVIEVQNSSLVLTEEKTDIWTELLGNFLTSHPPRATVERKARNVIKTRAKMLMKPQGKPVKQTLMLIIFMWNQYPKDTRVSPSSRHVVYTTCLSRSKYRILTAKFLALHIINIYAHNCMISI